jgi:hypothetical protein
MKIDMEKLKDALKALGASLKEVPAYAPSDPRVVRFTRLCALRASLRGRLHWAPGTNLCEARWIFGVPCLVHKDLSDPTYMQHEYIPITLEIQQRWVESLMQEFAVEGQEAEAVA